MCFGLGLASATTGAPWRCTRPLERSSTTTAGACRGTWTPWSNCPAWVRTRRPRSRRSATAMPIAALDGNVRRVAARAIRGAEPDEVPAAQLTSDAQAWLDPTAPGDWNQAIMDIGRLFCRPAPRCEDCPLATRCRFRGAGRVGRPSGRRQSRFEGSPRQVRGAVVRELRSVSLGERRGARRAHRPHPDRGRHGDRGPHDRGDRRAHPLWPLPAPASLTPS